MSITRIPATLLAAIKTAAVGRIAEVVLFRGFRLGSVGEVGGLPGISAISPRPGLYAQWAKQALTWRGNLPARVISRSNISIREDGDPEFSVKVTDPGTLTRSSAAGSDVIYGLALPDLPSVGEAGFWADAMGTSAAGTSHFRQNFTPGGSLDTQTWTASLYVKRAPGATTMPPLAFLVVILADGTQAATVAFSTLSNIAGWQRIQVSKTFSAPTSGTVQLQVRIIGNVGERYFQMAGAQLELAASASAYQLTQQAAVGTVNKLVNSHYPGRTGWTPSGSPVLTSTVGPDPGGRVIGAAPGAVGLSLATLGMALTDGAFEFRPVDAYGVTGDKFAATSVVGAPAVHKTVTGLTPLNKVYVFSVFARQTATNAQPSLFLQMRNQDAALTIFQTFSSQSMPLTAYWRRYWMACTFTSGAADRVNALVRTIQANGTKDMEIFGAQLEEFASGERIPSFYQDTVASAGTRNLLTRSADFADASWTKSEVTVTSNVASAPIVKWDVFHPDRGVLPAQIEANPDSVTIGATAQYTAADSAVGASDGFSGTLFTVGAEGAADLLAGAGDFKTWAAGAPSGWTVVVTKGTITQESTAPNVWPNDEDAADTSSAKYVQTLARTGMEDYLQIAYTVPAAAWHTLTFRFRGAEFPAVQITDGGGVNGLQGDATTWSAVPAVILKPAGKGGLTSPVWGLAVVHFFSPAQGIRIRIGAYPQAVVGGLPTYFDQVRLFGAGGQLYASTDRPETLQTSREASQGLFVLARGIVDDHDRGDEATVNLKCVGYLNGLDHKVPRRSAVAECQWKFMGTSCGYVSTTTCAETRTGTLHKAASVTQLETLRHIVLPDNVTVRRILTILPGSNEFTVDQSCTMTNGEAIRYADCRRTFADCSFRQRTHAYGGLRGVTGLVSLGSAVEINNLLASIANLIRLGADPQHPYMIAMQQRLAALMGSVGSSQDLFTHDSLPIVYGRRPVKLIPIERQIVIAPVPSLPDAAYTSAFYAIAEGPIETIRALLSLDQAVAHQGSATGAKQWWYWRRGGVGVDSYFTEANWVADKATQLLAQNRDFRSNTGTAYSEMAYLILQALGELPGGSGDVAASGSVPDLWADIKGIRVQAYDAAGAVSGSPAWSQSPAWCLLDLLTSKRYGCGLPLELFDVPAFYVAAQICAELLASSEAVSVTAAPVAASKEVPLLSVGGFAPEMTVTIVGQADQVVDFVDVVEQTLILKAAVTISAGVGVQAMVQRYTLNLTISEPRKAVEAVAAILLACRGRLIYDGQKMALKIDDALASETNHAYSYAPTENRGMVPRSYRTDLRGWRNAPNVLEVMYSRGTASRPENALHRIPDAQNGGTDFPKPLQLQILGAETADQAARCGLARFARVTASDAGGEQNQADGFSFQTFLQGLVPQLGDKISATRLSGSETPVTFTGRLATKTIDPKLLVTLKATGERTTMRFDPFGPSYDLFTGDVIRGRSSEPGETAVPGAITIAIARQAGREVMLGVSRTGFRYSPVPNPATNGGRVGRTFGTFEVHASTVTGFTPAIGYRGTGATLLATFPASRRRLTFSVPDELIEVPIFLKVVWVGVRPSGAQSSNELGTTVYRIDRGETDPTQTSGASPHNMVYEGDFIQLNGVQDNAIGWRHNSVTTTTDRDPSGHTTPSVNAWGQDSNAAFATPTRAYDNLAGDAQAAVGTADHDPGGIGKTYATIHFAWSAATRTGRGKVLCRQASGLGSTLLYYRTTTGGAWTLFATVTDTAYQTYRAPTVYAQDMSQYAVAVVCKAQGGIVSHGNIAWVDEVNFEEDTAGTSINVTIANNVLTLRADGTNYANGWRRFPGKNPPDTGVYFTAGTLNMVRMNAKRTVSGSAPSHPIEVVLVDDLTATETVILQIATGDVTASWQAFAAQFYAATPISGRMQIYVRTKSTNAVDCDKLMVARTELLPAWIPSAEEQAAGYFGDFTLGDALGFNRGAWIPGPTTYKKSAVA